MNNLFAKLIICFSMKYFFIIAILLCNVPSYSQQNPLINDIIMEVNIDTMVAEVRRVSGEDSTFVNGTKVLMKNRSNEAGRNLSADYLFQKLESFGLSPVNQTYSTGRNIYAIQEGQVNPDNIYIVCGHYDAVADYCADDNGSGITATLETARIFANYSFENSVVYAFWDQEEVGLVGSGYYANWAASNNLNILGVINFETFGYDSNNDFAFDIHANSDPNTTALVNAVVNSKNDYNLSAVPGIFDNGPTTSDQASFWMNDFGAIAFGGALFSNGGDLNPYYHTSNDRIEHFNTTYFHEVVKLGVATIATLAIPIGTTSIETDSFTDIKFTVYPNPASEALQIKIEGAEINTISIFDFHGRKIRVFSADKTLLNIKGLTVGKYILQVDTDKGILNKKIVIN